MNKQRDVSIAILKFFAVLLITNSHMELLYGKYSVLASGGAIGDVLFFFCSGFTLFLGRERRFDNYYKRRINRIYPTVFMWALMASAVFGIHKDMTNIVLYGGGWFVSCIMIYYVVLYFVRKYMFQHLQAVFVGSLIVSLLWYVLIDRPDGYNMYGFTYFKWCHYFSFMLLGAMLGAKKYNVVFSLKLDVFKLLASIVAFYAILLMGKKWSWMDDLQIVSLLPLLAITFYFYKVCNSDCLKKVYQAKDLSPVLKTISGLCLEVYLVQYVLFTDKLNSCFPLNIVIIFVFILFVAYVLRCLARFFSQTFKEDDYVWKQIFKLY